MNLMCRRCRIVNLMTLILFLVSWYHNLLTVSSDTPPDIKTGAALTIVQNEENDDGDGEVTVEENGDGDIEQEPPELFKPSKDWKTVKQGQAVPQGLHVRLNLETGEREAKLVEGYHGFERIKSKDNGGSLFSEKTKFTQEELKKALRDFSGMDLREEEEYSKNAEEVKKKFRSYKELKEDFVKINMDIKTEGEIITEMVKQLNKPDITAKDKLQVLSELEYLLHQIDNAVLFSDLGGLELAIKALNDTDSDIKAEATMVLGSALQSNPKVQVLALQTSAMQMFLSLITEESSVAQRSKALFALSSLIRQFPVAQKKFLDFGGLTALASLFHRSGMEKLQVKAVTLLNDLLQEQQSFQVLANLNDPKQKEKLQQYEEVHLEAALQEKGFCDLLPPLLFLPDHDSREKILHAMRTLGSPCHSYFNKAQSILLQLQSEYQKLADEEVAESDKYFTSMLNSVKAVISSLNLKEEL
ncbi:hypothetical protein ACJMK2_006053 [Sinanodonta woodiana]|uniref:Nucleotide exchange factor SIL1 n=1 Tax=Sinanodonta woodiana TaxID=1069815 RepID=A0ABD3VTL3_SINWO